MGRRPGSSRAVQILTFATCALLLATSLPLLSGCSTKREQQPLEVETGRRAGTTHDGLVRMRGSDFEGVWVKPGIDISEYGRLLIGPVRMSYKRRPTTSRTSSNFPLSDDQKERMEQMLRNELESEIDSSKSWSMAEGPGHDVLLIEPFLLDLVVTVPPGQTSGRDRTFSTSAGQVTLVLEVRDSQSDEILARMADRREATNPGATSQQLTWSNPVSNTSAVRSLFRRWARIFVARLDTAARLSAERQAGEGAASSE